MIRHFTLAIPASVALIGCAGSYAAPEPARPATSLCNAAAVQSFVGQPATAATGAAILASSKARNLRWGPPNSAWTMDFREERVNVRYDDAMVITDITCG